MMGWSVSSLDVGITAKVTGVVIQKNYKVNLFRHLFNMFPRRLPNIKEAAA